MARQRAIPERPTDTETTTSVRPLGGSESTDGTTYYVPGDEQIGTSVAERLEAADDGVTAVGPSFDESKVTGFE